MGCIFWEQPPSCTICMDSRKLQCLIDKGEHVVSPEGKKELAKILKEEINASKRKKGAPHV